MFRYFSQTLNFNHLWSFDFFKFLCLNSVLLELVFLNLSIFTTIYVRNANFRIVVFMFFGAFWWNFVMLLIWNLGLPLLCLFRDFFPTLNCKYIFNLMSIFARLFRISNIPGILMFYLYWLFFFWYFFRLLFWFIILTGLTIRIVLFRLLF